MRLAAAARPGDRLYIDQLADTAVAAAVPGWGGKQSACHPILEIRGSIAMTVSASEFAVDLEQLNSAIASVQASHDQIAALSSQLIQLLDQVETAWNAPSGHSFAAFVPQVQSTSSKLLTLLAEIIQAMQASYANYQSAETSNVANLPPS
jgi:WXG100 family type VII secretion target